MRIRSFTTHPYRLPLTAQVVWGGSAHTVRVGALLRIEDDEGRVGWGDAAPLPGFSAESVSDAERALTDLGGMLVGREMTPSDALSPDTSLHQELDALASAGRFPSSARFALDLALADIAAQAIGKTLPYALSPDPDVIVPLSGLLMGVDPKALVQDAERLAKAGFRSFKLKVGRGALADEAVLVRELVTSVLPPRSLRLDANRAWTLEQATRFAELVSDLVLDYVEEPLRDPTQLPEFWLDTGLPVALDETIQESGAEAIRGFARAAVLKPTLVGGLMATLRLAAHARSVGVQPVLSASFESAVGLRGVAALAAAIGGSAAGLDTARWLASDVLSPRPWPLDAAMLDVPSVFGTEIDPVLL